MSDSFFEQLKAPAPVTPGTRVRLLHMQDDPVPIPPGTEGTVTGGNGSQLYVDWDTGRRLMLLVGVDRWEVV